MIPSIIGVADPESRIPSRDSTHGEIRLSGSIMEGILLKYARLLTAS